jgi:glycosyltransferase involved in cell wall biosynthesis
MRLSICVPVFDPDQEYSEHLFQLVNSIKTQTMKPDEVVMTANHNLEYLDNLKEVINGDFELVFKRNESNGSAENTNHAMSLCRGEIVKIMHQDDFFVNENALNFTYDALQKSKKNWRVSAFDQFVESTSITVRPSKPKITWRLVNGVNRIGAPSGVALKRQAFIPFDEEMKYMFDCDWYLKMWHNWRKPLVSKHVEVRIRIHAGQATNWAKHLLQKEILATKQNHDKLHVRKSRCLCTIHKNRQDPGGVS